MKNTREAAIQAATTRAQKLARVMYVLATAYGYRIADNPAPFNRRCYAVTSDGQVAVVGKW